MSFVPRFDVGSVQPRSQQPRFSQHSTTTTTQNLCDTLYLLAISENRTKEVGIAAINLKSPVVSLSQFCDNHTYVHTMTTILIYQPAEILLPNTALDTELYLQIKSQFPSVSVVTIARKYFSESKGTLLIRQLVLDEDSNIELAVSSKYLTLASFAALIKYIEFVQHISFSLHSLKITFRGCEGTIFIDASSIRDLEIVANKRTGDPRHSLFGIVNQTKTPQGARLLKTNLLQPPADIDTIQARLQCVTELLKNEKLFFDLNAILPHFLDLDHLISQLVQIPKKPTLKHSQMSVTNVIYLKHTLELLPSLVSAMASCECGLLRAILENLSHPHIRFLKEKIDEIINENTSFSKGTQQMITQQCFAIKPGINGLLDAARKVYTETIEDIYTLVNTYRQNFRLDNLKINYSNKRGYFLTLPGTVLNIPEIFIQASKQGKKWICTTEALLSLNQRNKEALTEIYIMTDRVLEELMATIRQKLCVIYKISESVAFLDMILSFANYVTLNDKCVCPEFTEDGPLAISQGRHPILEKISKEPFIPNNIFASEFQNFHIITGPNMSGKSTYLSQICLLTILSHAGCYVPANYASFRLVSRIFTRMGTEDIIEMNASSFMKEMKEMAFIIRNASSRSLIVIDELGRSTSNRDAIPICYSISEYLLSLDVYTFFVTHYLDFAENLAQMYPNVKVHHFVVDSTAERSVRYLYQLESGCAREESYGIDMAMTVGFPNDLILRAKAVRQFLIEKEHEKRNRRKRDTNHAMYNLVERLYLLKNSTLDETGLRTYLKELKSNFFSNVRVETPSTSSPTITNNNNNNNNNNNHNK